MCSLLSQVAFGQISIVHTGCHSFEVSVPSSTTTCNNCFSRTPLNDQNKMFIQFRLRRVNSNGSLTTIEIKNTVNEFSTSFAVPLNTRHRWVIEAYRSEVIGNCTIALRDPQTGAIGCRGQWEAISSTPPIEIGLPQLIFNIDLPNDPTPDNVFTQAELDANFDLEFGIIRGFGKRRWSCHIKRYRLVTPEIERGFAGIPWQDGEVPQSFNIYTGVWRNGRDWRFWAGNRYDVTVVLDTGPCNGGWFSRTVSFTVQ